MTKVFDNIVWPFNKGRSAIWCCLEAGAKPLWSSCEATMKPWWLCGSFLLALQWHGLASLLIINDKMYYQTFKATVPLCISRTNEKTFHLNLCISHKNELVFLSIFRYLSSPFKKSWFKVKINQMENTFFCESVTQMNAILFKIDKIE